MVYYLINSRYLNTFLAVEAVRKRSTRLSHVIGSQEINMAAKVVQ